MLILIQWTLFSYENMSKGGKRKGHKNKSCNEIRGLVLYNYIQSISIQTKILLHRDLQSIFHLKYILLQILRSLRSGPGLAVFYKKLGRESCLIDSNLPVLITLVAENPLMAVSLQTSSGSQSARKQLRPSSAASW